MRIAPPVSPNGDTLLTAPDVEELDLDGSELVVLSVCETGLGDLTNRSVPVLSASVRWPVGIVRIGWLMAILASASDRVAAQAVFQPRGWDQWQVEAIGEQPFNLCRQEEELYVLEWELDRLFGWEMSPSLYPEAARPEAPVTEIDRDEADWQIAKPARGPASGICRADFTTGARPGIRKQHPRAHRHRGC